MLPDEPDPAVSVGRILRPIFSGRSFKNNMIYVTKWVLMLRSSKHFTRRCSWNIKALEKSMNTTHTQVPEKSKGCRTASKRVRTVSYPPN